MRHPQASRNSSVSADEISKSGNTNAGRKAKAWVRVGKGNPKRSTIWFMREKRPLKDGRTNK